MEKRKPFYTVGGNVNWCSHYGKQSGGSLEKTKDRITIWFNNLTPGNISREDKNSNSKRYTPLFIVKLFIIIKTWQQPKCPSTEEEIKMWYICTIEYYTPVKIEWNIAICSNMDGPRDYYTMLSKLDKDKYNMVSLICGI